MSLEKQAYPNQSHLEIAVPVSQCCSIPKPKKNDKPREEGIK